MSWHDGYQVWLTESQSLANAQNVVNHLYGNTDWSRESICALVGNMRHESSINPNMYEYGYAWGADRGFGLVQWTPRSKYWDWAVANGKEPRDGDSQLDRIDYEVANNIQWIPRADYGRMTFSQFRSNSGDWSIGYLTEAFTWGYERPNAQAGWNSMPDRKAFAQRAYNELDWSGSGNGGGGDNGGGDTGGGGGDTEVEVEGGSITYVESQGDILFIHIDSGDQVKAYPSTAQRWIAEENSIGGGSVTVPGDGGGNDGDNGGDNGGGDVVHGDWANPLGNQRCTQAYGTTRWTSYHSGMDLGAKSPGVAGDPQYAVHGGTVVATGPHQQVLAYNSGYGLMLDIGVHDGKQTHVFYGHCDARNPFAVSTGDTVKAGDVVAYMGGSGASGSNSDFAVHMHIVVIQGLPTPSSFPMVAGRANTVDPEQFFRSKGLLQEMNSCPR